MEEEPGVGGLEPGLAEPGLTGLAGLESAGIEPPASPEPEPEPAGADTTAAAAGPADTTTSLAPPDDGSSALMEEIDVTDESPNAPQPHPTGSGSRLTRPKLSKSRDLFVTVEDPQQIGDGSPWGLGGYTAYSIRTKTSRPDYGPAETIVLRRFSDFVWLREQLTYEFETRLLPPMPPKNEMNKKAPSFIEARRAGLARFMSRLVDHPILSTSQCLRCFLLTKAHEFQNAKREFERSLLSRMNESVTRIASSILAKKRDPQMQQLQDQVDTYDELMAQLTSCSAGAEQRYKDLRICFKEMGGAVGTYAEKEDELREPLRKFQSILEHEGEKFGGMHEKMGATVVEPLRDYHRYAECFRGALSKYKALQVDAQVLEDMLATEKKKLNDVSKSGSQTMSVGAILGDDPAEVQAQKKESTEAQITNLTPVVEQAYDSIEIAKSDILADLDRFNAGQIEDWRHAYGALADANIDYYTSTMEKWDDFILELQDDKND